MRRRALVPVAIVVLVVGSSGVPRGAAQAADELASPPPDALLVPTQAVASTGEAPAGTVRAVGLPVTFELVEDEGFPIGTMTAGERRLPIALVRGYGAAGALLADIDADGRPTRATESFPVGVEAWIVRDQAIGLVWKSTVTWGRGAFALTIRDRIGTLNGQWAPSGEGARSTEAAAPAPTPLVFDPEVPPSISKPPVTTARVRYASFPVGERRVVVAALRGAKDDLAFLVDAEGSGDLSDLARRVRTRAQPVRRGAVQTGTTFTSDPIDVLGAQGTLTALETLPSIQGSAEPTSSRSGIAKVAGEPYTLVLVDGDFDGAYTSATDWWGFAPSDAVDSPNPDKLYEGNRPCYRGASRAWRLVGVRDDGIAILAPVASPEPVGEYLRGRAERVNARRWFPRFDADRDEFLRTQGLDRDRPLATKPVAWHHALTLADARAIAKAEGKPLLVDFEADWCVWCKRLDWIIYPDREVADRLARFTAVKVNVELDPVASFQAVEGIDGPWGGLPAVGVFDDAGKPVSFPATWDKAKGATVDHIDGFKRPEAFAAALDKAYEAVRAGR